MVKQKAGEKLNDKQLLAKIESRLLYLLVVTLCVFPTCTDAFQWLVRTEFSTPKCSASSVGINGIKLFQMNKCVQLSATTSKLVTCNSTTSIVHTQTTTFAMSGACQGTGTTLTNPTVKSACTSGVRYFCMDGGTTSLPSSIVGNGSSSSLLLLEQYSGVGIWNYADDNNKGSTCPYFAGPDYVTVAPTACQSDGVTSWQSGCADVPCSDFMYHYKTWNNNAFCQGAPFQSTSVPINTCTNVLTYFTSTTAGWAAPTLLQIPGVQILRFGNPSVIAKFSLTNLPQEVIIAIIVLSIVALASCMLAGWYAFFIVFPKRAARKAAFNAKNQTQTQA